MSPAVPKEGRLRDAWWVKQVMDLGPKLVLGTNIMLALEISVRNGIVGAFGRNATLAFIMAGSFVIHMWTRPRRGEIIGALFCGALLALGYTRIWGGPGLSMADLAGSFLGVGSIAVLGAIALAASPESRREKAVTLGAASVLPFMWIVTALSISFTTKINPSTRDLYLYAFDASLGIQPSFLAGRLFQQQQMLQKFSEIIYYAMPFNISILYGWHRMNSHRLPGMKILLLFLSSSAAGFLLYYLFPATGPVYAFGKAFPGSPPDVHALVMGPLTVADAPRNAMPSLHTAAALLVFWNSVAWPKWARAAAGLFLAITLLATLGFGEHYLIDLVVAVPFSLALQAAWTAAAPWSAPERRQAVVIGAVLVAAWFVLLRIGAPLFLLSPAVPWSLIAITLVPCLLLRRRLLHAANGVMPV